MNQIVKLHEVEHYTWGENCDGWHLVKSESLSIIRETMPSQTSEKLHYHQKAKQFFLILKGTATFEIDGANYIVESNEGILIKPGSHHRISNQTESALEFIVTSNPKSHGDRIDLSEN